MRWIGWLLLLLAGSFARGDEKFVQLTYETGDANAANVVRERLAVAGHERAWVGDRDGGFVVRVPWSRRDAVAAVKKLIARRGVVEFRITVENDADVFAACGKRFAAAKDREAARMVRVRDLPVAAREKYPFGLRWYRLGPEELHSRALRAGGEHWMLVELDDHEITGEALENVAVRWSPSSETSWTVRFDIAPEFHEPMARLTDAGGGGRYLAIVLDDRVLQARVLVTAVLKNVQIAGGYDEARARALAAVLRAGALRRVPRLVKQE